MTAEELKGQLDRIEIRQAELAENLSQIGAGLVTLTRLFQSLTTDVTAISQHLAANERVGVRRLPRSDGSA